MATTYPQLEAAARKFLESQGYRIQHPREQVQSQRESARESLSQNVAGFRNVFQWAAGIASSDKSCILLGLVPIFVHLFFDLIEAREINLAEKLLTDHKLLAGVHAACDRILEGFASIKKPNQLDDNDLYTLFSKGHLLNLCIPEDAYDKLLARLVSTRVALADIFNRRVRVVSTPDVSKARLVLDSSYDEEELVNGSVLHLKVDAANPPVAYSSCWKTVLPGSDSQKVYSAGNIEKKCGLPLPDSSSSQRRSASMHFAKLAEDRHELCMKRLPDVKLFIADVRDCDDDINCMTISNDGRLCVAGLRNARIWDLDDQIEDVQDAKRNRANPASTPLCAYHDLDGDQGRVLDVSFSADTELLLTGGLDSTVQLWNVRDKKRVKVFSSQNCHKPIWAVDWCPLGHYFASSGANGKAFLWSVERTSPLRPFIRKCGDSSREVEVVRAHPSGRYTSIVYKDQIVLWDNMVAKPARILLVNDMVTALGFSTDGTRIVVGTHGGSLQPWDLLSAKPMKPALPAHHGPVTSVDFSWPCGNSFDMAFSCGHDGLVRFWSQGSLCSGDNAGTEQTISLPLRGVHHSKQHPIVMDGMFTPSNNLFLACI